MKTKWFSQIRNKYINQHIQSLSFMSFDLQNLINKFNFSNITRVPKYYPYPYRHEFDNTKVSGCAMCTTLIYNYSPYHKVRMSSRRRAGELSSHGIHRPGLPEGGPGRELSSHAIHAFSAVSSIYTCICVCVPVV